VGSRITGTIQKLYVDERDFVKVGQIIAQIDDSDLRQQVDNAKAQLQSAQAAADQAVRDWEREKRLVATGVVSYQEADQYEERYLTTKRAVDAASAQLKYQEANLGYAQIRSLVSGVVTKRWVDLGDAVIAGQPLFTVADTDLVYANAYVDQRFSGRIKSGQPALVMLRGSDGAPIRGRVFRVTPEADPAAEEMTVEVAFELKPQELEIGQWADVYIRIGEAKDGLAVPQASIMPMGNDRFVFVVGENKKLRMVKVEPVAMSPRLPMVAVRADLLPGDLVAMMPMGLSAGQTVQVDKVNMAQMTGSVAMTDKP
jgi:HlyD family secretion protein